MLRLLLLLAFSAPLLAAPLQYWRDTRGVIHLEGRGDTPAATVAPKPEPEPAPTEGTVTHIPDGDTVHLEGGVKLRLIGLNAPEVAHHNRAGEPGGEAARRFLRTRLDQRRVRLEHDAERRDRYDRELVHLYDDQGHSINELLLREGHAWLAPYPPNLRHIERYAAAEAEARTARRGLWALPRYGVTDTRGVLDQRNSFRRLRGRITRLEWRGSETRLVLDERVALRLDDGAVARFRAAGLDPANLRGRQLVVRGRLGGGRELPTIRLRHPLQIEEIE